MSSVKTVLLIILVSLSGCGKDEVAEPKDIQMTGVELSESTKTLKIGETYKITADVKPTNTTESKTVSWESSNMDVVTVNSNGLITAVSVGEAMITAKAGSKEATCRVTVVPIEVTGVSLNEISKEIQIGESFTLTTKIDPVNATNQSVVWSSSDESVVKVDSGVVTGLSVGDATITVKSVSGDHSAECKVSVKPIPVSEIFFKEERVSIAEGRMHQLSVSVMPENATNKTVSYESLSTNIFTVSSTGLITALKEGVGSVVAKSSNGLIAKIEVEVESFITEFVTGMTFGTYSNPGGYISFSGNLTLSNYSIKRAFVESYFIENGDGYLVAGGSVGRYIEVGEKLFFPVSISNIYGATANFVITDNSKTYIVKRKL